MMLASQQQERQEPQQGVSNVVVIEEDEDESGMSDYDEVGWCHKRLEGVSTQTQLELNSNRTTDSIQKRITIQTTTKKKKRRVKN